MGTGDSILADVEHIDFIIPRKWIQYRRIRILVYCAGAILLEQSYQRRTPRSLTGFVNTNGGNFSLRH
jgi:hypothetical protein